MCGRERVNACFSLAVPLPHYFCVDYGDDAKVAATAQPQLQQQQHGRTHGASKREAACTEEMPVIGMREREMWRKCESKSKPAAVFSRLFPSSAVVLSNQRTKRQTVSLRQSVVKVHTTTATDRKDAESCEKREEKRVRQEQGLQAAAKGVREGSSKSVGLDSHSQPMLCLTCEPAWLSMCMRQSSVRQIEAAEASTAVAAMVQQQQR